jgi:radical SAM superfamily enzyme YgiQ (UPF0313 family)
MKKVIFILDSVFEHQGVQSLSAFLKSCGYGAEALFYEKGKDAELLAKVAAQAPLLIGFSVTSMNFQWAVDLAAHIKKLGVPVVFGGPHPTYFPEFIETEGVDIICAGEGESPLLELVKALESGGDYTGIKNLHVKSGGKIYRNELRCLVEDLDSLPYLDRAIFYKNSKLLAGFSSKRFLIGRGCPYDCTYCHNHELRASYTGKGRFVRFRSPQNIIGEMKKVREDYGMKTVSFCADTFTLYPRLSEFLDLYKKEIGLPFFCQGRFNELTEEMVRQLGEAGCFYMALGVESGSERLRNIVLKRNMSDEQIIRGSALLHKYGIKIIAYVMFGLPGETLEEAVSTVEMLGRIGADSIAPTIYQPIIKTELWTYMERHGLFEEKAAQSFSHYSYSSPVKMAHKREIVNLHKIAFLGMRFPSLLPAIRLLIKLPHNPLFKLLNDYDLFRTYKMSRAMGLGEMLRLAWKIRKMT